jgi:hypothetical protein
LVMKAMAHQEVLKNRGKSMKRYLGFAIMLILIGRYGSALADNISVSGNPGALIVNSTTAGSDLIAATDATTTYSIETTTGNKKITGAINSAMPANTSLKVTLTAPSGAFGMFDVILTVTAKNLVIGIDNGTKESGLGISYEFSATVEAGIVSMSSKTVTFTIVDSS